MLLIGMHRGKRAWIGAMLVFPGPRSGTRNPECRHRRNEPHPMRLERDRTLPNNWMSTSVPDSGFRSAAPE
jgi:hypothetical protein